MTARTVVPAVLGLALAAVLITWALRRADVGRFVDSLAQADWVYLLPVVLCEAAVHLAKAWKWTGLLTPVKTVRLGSALSAVLVGGAATQVIPLRLDELLRAKILSDAEGLSSASVLATVAVDRIIEILMLGSLIGVIALAGPPPGALGTAWRILAVVFGVGVVGLVAFLRLEAPITNRLRAWDGVGAGLVAKAADMATDIGATLRAIPRGAALGRVVTGTLVEWGAVIVGYGFVLAAFGITAPLRVPLTLALGGAAAYGVPNVPGAIGTFEAALVSLLEPLLGLAPADALAIAVTAHLLLTIPVTVAGAAVALRLWLRRKA